MALVRERSRVRSSLAAPAFPSKTEGCSAHPLPCPPAGGREHGGNIEPRAGENRGTSFSDRSTFETLNALFAEYPDAPTVAVNDGRERLGTVVTLPGLYRAKRILAYDACDRFAGEFGETKHATRALAKARP